MPSIEDFVDSKRLDCPFVGCSKSYTKPSRLKEHFRSHTDDRPYNCLYCNQSFIRSEHRIAHVRFKHSSEEDLHVCSICNKGFKTMQHLKRHVPIHEQPGYACYVCSSSFISKSLLKQHLFIDHDDLKLHPCPNFPQCHSSFITPSKLARHIQQVHSKEGKKENTYEKSYDCKVCEHEFSSADLLKQHLPKHERVKSISNVFNCPESTCEKFYTRRSALQHHIDIVHKGMRPYICSKCGKGLSTKAALDKHHIVHLRLEENLTQIDTRLLSEERHLSELTALEKLNGADYASRKLSCNVEGCVFRSNRAYDLQRHMESKHHLASN